MDKDTIKAILGPILEEWKTEFFNQLKESCIEKAEHIANSYMLETFTLGSEEMAKIMGIDKQTLIRYAREDDQFPAIRWNQNGPWRFFPLEVVAWARVNKSSKFNTKIDFMSIQKLHKEMKLSA